MKYRSIGLALIVASALAAGLAPAGAQESAASLDAPLALVAKHDPQAQFVIGSMYYKGSSGVRRDHAMAAKWYRTAAEQGHVKAQVNLGSCTSRAKASRRTMSRRRVGFARRPRTATPPWPSTISP